MTENLVYFTFPEAVTLHIELMCANPPVRTRKNDAMSKTLTYEIPDELFAAFEQMAAQTGTTPDALALQWLARRVHVQRPPLNDAERRVALEQLMHYAGAVDSGDSRSADNERIDRDLAREYASTHDDE